MNKLESKLDRTPVITQVYYSIIRRLVKLLIKYGLHYNEAATLLKFAYVESARQDFALSNRCPSDIRVATITGINRVDIKRCDKLQLKLTDGDQEWGFGNRVSAVITGWLHDDGYCDENGNIDLKKHGDAPSLEDLIKRHTGDMTVKSVLEELLVNQIVKELPNKKIRLLRTEYVIGGEGKDPEEVNSRLHILGRMVDHLLSTITHNHTHKKSEERLQLELFYKNLPVDLAREFEVKSSGEFEGHLIKWNEWIQEELKKRNNQAEEIGGLVGSGPKTNKATEKRWVGMGIYFVDATPDDQSTQQ